MLLVQGHGEWNRLANHVGARRSAGHVGRTDKMSSRGFRTEIAPGVFVKVEEVLSPDLHESGTVFGSITGVDSTHNCGWVESERLGIRRIGEITGERNGKRNNFGSIAFRRIRTHQTNRLSIFMLSFDRKHVKGRFSARYVCRRHNHIAFAEFALRLRVNKLHVFERSSADHDTSGASGGTTLRVDRINLDAELVASHVLLF